MRPNLQGYEVHAVDDAPIHVSLSRTVVLHHHQIDQFVATCRMALSQCKPYVASIRAGRPLAAVKSFWCSASSDLCCFWCCACIENNRCKDDIAWNRIFR
jgi:hypothetical protein